MTPEQSALLIPSKVLFELWHATVFHLFEKGGIDAATLAALLKPRQKFHEDLDNAEIAQLLGGCIGWLEGLEHGKFSAPKLH